MTVVPSSFRVRHVRRADVDRINAMYRDEYGEGYPYPLHSKMNGRGARLVAELQGSVIAFARAMEDTGHPGTYELGGMIVDPSFRRSGLAAHMTDLRLISVEALGGHVAFAEPICSLPTCASQRNIDNHGFVSVGILPCKYPDLKPALLGEQGESVVLAVKSIDDDATFDDRTLYLSDVHERLVASMLPEAVGADRSREEMREAFPTIVRHEPVPGPRSFGARFVDVPANWPESRVAAAELEREGFAFCAFLPRFGRTASGAVFDSVRFVHLGDRRARFDLIHVIDRLAPLKDYLSARLGG